MKHSEKKLTLTFVGGARKVTGANFLLEAFDGDRVTRMLVDCGIEQGSRFCESRNKEPFPYDPKTIDTLFLTHAHADHIGLYPKLSREGFGGTTYATKATKDLVPVMLKDSVSIMTREAKFCDEEPPYTSADIESAVAKIKAVDYRKKIEVAPGISATLYNAGHILGSSTVLIDVWGTRLLFTGDLGKVPAQLTEDRDVPEEKVHYLITESVYGNRTHVPVEDSERDLLAAVKSITKNKGTLLIPSFSLERTQIILETLDRFITEKKLDPLPVFLDAPLATLVTGVYKENTSFLRKSLQEQIQRGDDPFSFPSLKVTYSKDDSKQVDSEAPPKIIIAGAGMSHGGRIRSHEKTYLPDPRSYLLLVGYQVPGGLGRRLQDGAKKVQIDKKTVKVRATVSKTGGFSAHADRDDLVKFVEDTNPEEVFVVLGELEASRFLAQRISGFLGIKTTIPQRGEEFELALH